MRRFSLAFHLIVLAALVITASAYAQAPVCHTAGQVMLELSQLNVRSDKIVRTDDAELIDGYLSALGATLPEGVVVSRIIFADFGNTVPASLVGPDGCVPLILAVPPSAHGPALKSAASGI